MLVLLDVLCCVSCVCCRCSLGLLAVAVYRCSLLFVVCLWLLFVIVDCVLFIFVGDCC